MTSDASDASDRLRFRLRRIDREPDDRIPAVAFLTREVAEETAASIRGFRKWGEVYHYYIGDTSGSARTHDTRQKGGYPAATFTLPAEELEYLRELAKKQKRSMSSIVVEGIGFVRRKHGEG